MRTIPHFHNMARTGRKVPMSYRSDRESFVYLMGRRGIPLFAARSILSDAGICQRAAEVDCSVSDSLIRASAEKATEAAWKRLNVTVGALLGSWRVAFGGDPRGCVVTLANATEDIGVPAQGYSSRQIERMGAR